MSHSEPISPTAAEARALALLHDLRSPPRLTARARARIAQELHELASTHSSGRAPRGWIALATLTAGVVACLVFCNLWRLCTPTHQALTVPACAITHLASKDSYHAAVVGPAEMRIDSVPGKQCALSLRAGRLAMATAAEAVEVEVPDARITIAPHALAEVTVQYKHATTVATYAGTVQVVWTDSRRMVIGPGQRWSAEPAHQPPLAPAAEIQRLIEAGTAADLHLCMSVNPETLSSSINVPPLPQERKRPRISKYMNSIHESVTAPPPAPLPPPSLVAVTPNALGEATLLSQAIKQLHHDYDAHRALDSLEQLAGQYPNGQLAQEATLIRIEALIRLGEEPAALQQLDSLSLPAVPRGRELLLLRAGLRAAAGRCRAAIDDYNLAHTGDAAAPDEAALFGRAVCRSRIGDREGAQADMKAYLAAFPQGRFAAEAKLAIGE